MRKIDTLLQTAMLSLAFMIMSKIILYMLNKNVLPKRCETIYSVQYISARLVTKICLFCVVHLCVGLCHVLARLPHEQVMNGFDGLCSLQIEQLERIVSVMNSSVLVAVLMLTL